MGAYMTGVAVEGDQQAVPFMQARPVPLQVSGRTYRATQQWQLSLWARKLRKDEGMAKAVKVLDDVAEQPLVKTRQRVQDHAEVLTPAWLVDDMLDLVRDESERIDSRFLEPACGTGNFLVRILARKLATVKKRYGRSDFEKKHYALLALMCIYGIEIQADNVEDCRRNLLSVFSAYVGCARGDILYEAAEKVVEANIVHGDALAMRAYQSGSGTRTKRLRFAEWAYIGKGRYARRDFLYEQVAERATVKAGQGDHDAFKPVRDYPPLTVPQIASGSGDVPIPSYASDDDAAEAAMRIAQNVSQGELW